MLPHLLGLALLGTAIGSPLPQRVINIGFYASKAGHPDKLQRQIEESKNGKQCRLKFKGTGSLF
jgi:hypothetical protein